MQIQTQMNVVGDSKQLHDYVDQHALMALDKFEQRIQTVSIYLENSPSRKGDANSCRVDLTLDTGSDVHVRAEGSELQAIANEALQKAARMVAKRLEKPLSQAKRQRKESVSE